MLNLFNDMIFCKIIKARLFLKNFSQKLFRKVISLFLKDIFSVFCGYSYISMSLILKTMSCFKFDLMLNAFSYLLFQILCNVRYFQNLKWQWTLKLNTVDQLSWPTGSPSIRNKAFASLLSFYWLVENLQEKCVRGYLLW